MVATTPEDEKLIATVDAMIPDLFLRSLSGSFREGAVRCLLDLTETYPDRPARMPDVARGQCRSLSEDPSTRIDADLPVATSAPLARPPLELVPLAAPGLSLGLGPVPTDAPSRACPIASQEAAGLGLRRERPAPWPGLHLSGNPFPRRMQVEHFLPWSEIELRLACMV